MKQRETTILNKMIIEECRRWKQGGKERENWEKEVMSFMFANLGSFFYKLKYIVLLEY